MLTKPENELLELVRASRVGTKLRVVMSLPDLDGEDLVKKWAVDAPAVYVAAMPFKVGDGIATLRFGVAAVAKNSRGHEAARHGDGKQIGLYEMLGAVAAAIDAHATVSGTWSVTDGDFLYDEQLSKNGLYVGRLTVQTLVELPYLPDGELAQLDAFTTFHADIDAPPHEAEGEHEKWIAEPADHSTSLPEASDTVTLEQ